MVKVPLIVCAVAFWMVVVERPCMVMLPPVPIFPIRVVVTPYVAFPPMVSVLKSAVWPEERVTAILVLVGDMVTSSLELGTDPPLQLLAVSQVPVLAPAQLTAAAFTTGTVGSCMLKGDNPNTKYHKVVKITNQVVRR